MGTVAGLWVLVSPWVLSFAELDVAKWSNVLAGAAIILVFLWIRYGE